ncbi:MAG: tetratricopeptide repeat protein [Acidobacteriota bacterium]|nr:tetratricopeptide repeat protein [Acidobacteriota bacterium]
MKSILSVATVLAALTLTAFAQQAPKPKSQKEVDALKKVQADAQARNFDQEITDINGVLENFADTEYKDMLLNMAMEAAQRKGDYGQTVAFGQQIIQANPNDITGRVTLAETMASHIRDNDLDKDKSVKQVQDYANKALELLKTSTAPPAGIPEASWPELKKQLTAQAYDSLGQVDEVQKKYPDAITNYKSALDAQPTNPVSMVRIARAYVENKQYDDAITTADKVLAMADAPANVKQFAQQQKDAATKMKATPAK